MHANLASTPSASRHTTIVVNGINGFIAMSTNEAGCPVKESIAVSPIALVTEPLTLFMRDVFRALSTESDLFSGSIVGNPMIRHNERCLNHALSLLLSYVQPCLISRFVRSC